MSSSPPHDCPTCSAEIVRRVAGPWCPRCRRFLVLQMIPVAVHGNDPVQMLAWRLDPRVY